MRVEQRPECLVVQAPVGVQHPQPKLERPGLGVLVDQPDLLDQPIEAEPDRRVRDPVLRRELLLQ